MAEVSCQLQDSDQGKESDRLFIRTKARVEQWQADIAKVLRERSQEARLETATTSWEDSREHNIIHQRCYSWLRRAKIVNIERQSARLCIQITERAVEGAISKLMRLKMPRGSAHRKVRCLLRNSRSQIRRSKASAIQQQGHDRVTSWAQRHMI